MNIGFTSNVSAMKMEIKAYYTIGVAEATENRLYLRSELPNKEASFSSLTVQESKLLTIRVPNL